MTGFECRPEAWRREVYR